MSHLLSGMCLAVCCSVLQCVAVCYSVLQCVAMCCSVLQLVICAKALVLLNVPSALRYVFCSVLQCVADSYLRKGIGATECPVCCQVCVWKRVVVCYSVLQCVAVCCSALQCVAVCCSVLPFHPKNSPWLGQWHQKEHTEHLYFHIIRTMIYMIKTCVYTIHAQKKATPLYLPSNQQLLPRAATPIKVHGAFVFLYYTLYIHTMIYMIKTCVYTIHAQRKWRLYTYHPKNNCWLGQRHQLKHTEHVYFDLIHVVVFMIHTHVHMQDMRNKALNSCTKIQCFIKTSKHLCKYSEQMYFYTCIYDKTCKTSH